MPPWICPSTSVGLIARPTSWAATIRRTIDRPELEVHVHLGDLGAEPVGLVRDALPVGVERRRLRVVGAGPRSTQSRAATGSSPSSTTETARRPAPARDRRRAPASRPARPRQRQELATQVLGREPGRVARHERLARRRGLARVGRAVRVAARRARSTRPARPGRPRRSGRGPCSSPGRCPVAPREQDDGAVARARRSRSSDGLGSDVLPMPYHMAPIADAAADRARRRRPRCAPRPPRAAPPSAAASASRQAGRPALATRSWPVAVARPGPQRVARAGSRAGRCPSCAGEVVQQRLVGDRRLRDAEAAERAGRSGRSCRSARVVLRTAAHDVRAARVDRDAVGDRRAPRGVGAGVEVAVEVGRRSGGRRRRRRTSRRIRAGWRLVVDAHRLRARVDARGPGGRAASAAIAISGCSERSSLPPNPPPQALGMTRTRSAGRPRISASSSRSMYGVWVRREDLDPPVDHARASRPRARCRRARRRSSRTSRSPSTADAASAASTSPQPDAALDEHVARATPSWSVGAAGSERRVRSRRAAAAAPRRSAAPRRRSRRPSRRRRRARATASPA